MRIASDSESNEIEFSGTKEDWANFSAALRGTSAPFSLDVDFDPAPYPHMAKSVQLVEAASELLCISISEADSVIVRGHPAALEYFRNNVSECEKMRSEGDHIHMDSFGNEQIVSSDSASVVFSFRDE